jgi:hypothetical protein
MAGAVSFSGLKVPEDVLRPFGAVPDLAMADLPVPLD